LELVSVFLLKKLILETNLNNPFTKFIPILIIVFLVQSVAEPMPGLSAPNLSLPIPGQIIAPSSVFYPSVLKGIKVFKNNPLHLQFLLDTPQLSPESSEFKQQASDLVRYFLAGLTVPEQDLWVNLSPYEKDHIIPEALSQTAMGRDLLTQDYLLKQLTASLLVPESESSRDFWDRVYAKAYEHYGVTDIPAKALCKVWIVPQKAKVMTQDNTAFILKSRLKVMLEKDYLATVGEGLASSLNKNANNNKRTQTSTAPTEIIKTTDSTINLSRKESVPEMTKNIISEIILPLLDFEVNEGKHFAPLRQIFHSLILAKWFKKHLRESLLGQEYVDRNQIRGITIDDSKVKERIYQQYLASFKKGVYNQIREHYDPFKQEIVAREYALGGFSMQLREGASYNETSREEADEAMLSAIRNYKKQIHAVAVNLREPTESKDSSSPSDLGSKRAELLIQQIQQLEAKWDQLLQRLSQNQTKGMGEILTLRTKLQRHYKSLAQRIQDDQERLDPLSPLGMVLFQYAGLIKQLHRSYQERIILYLDLMGSQGQVPENILKKIQPQAQQIYAHWQDKKNQPRKWRDPANQEKEDKEQWLALKEKALDDLSQKQKRALQVDIDQQLRSYYATNIFNSIQGQFRRILYTQTLIGNQEVANIPIKWRKKIQEAPHNLSEHVFTGIVQKYADPDSNLEATIRAIARKYIAKNVQTLWKKHRMVMLTRMMVFIVSILIPVMLIQSDVPIDRKFPKAVNGPTIEVAKASLPHKVEQKDLPLEAKPKEIKQESPKVVEKKKSQKIVVPPTVKPPKKEVQKISKKPKYLPKGKKPLPPFITKILKPAPEQTPEEKQKITRTVQKTNKLMHQHKKTQQKITQIEQRQKIIQEKIHRREKQLKDQRDQLEKRRKEVEKLTKEKMARDKAHAQKNLKKSDDGSYWSQWFGNNSSGSSNTPTISASGLEEKITSSGGPDGGYKENVGTTDTGYLYLLKGIRTGLDLGKGTTLRDPTSFEVKLPSKGQSEFLNTQTVTINHGKSQQELVVPADATAISWIRPAPHSLHYVKGGTWLAKFYHTPGKIEIGVRPAKAREWPKPQKFRFYYNGKLLNKFQTNQMIARMLPAELKELWDEIRKLPPEKKIPQLLRSLSDFQYSTNPLIKSPLYSKGTQLATSIFYSIASCYPIGNIFVMGLHYVDVQDDYWLEDGFLNKGGKFEQPGHLWVRVGGKIIDPTDATQASIFSTMDPETVTEKDIQDEMRSFVRFQRLQKIREERKLKLQRIREERIQEQAAAYWAKISQHQREQANRLQLRYEQERLHYEKQEATLRYGRIKHKEALTALQALDQAHRNDRVWRRFVRNHDEIGLMAYAVYKLNIIEILTKKAWNTTTARRWARQSENRIFKSMDYLRKKQGWELKSPVPLAYHGISTADFSEYDLVETGIQARIKDGLGRADQWNVLRGQDLLIAIPRFSASQKSKGGIARDVKVTGNRKIKGLGQPFFLSLPEDKVQIGRTAIDEYPYALMELPSGEVVLISRTNEIITGLSKSSVDNVFIMPDGRAVVVQNFKLTQIPISKIYGSFAQEHNFTNIYLSVGNPRVFSDGSWMLPLKEGIQRWVLHGQGKGVEKFRGQKFGDLNMLDLGPVKDSWAAVVDGKKLIGGGKWFESQNFNQLKNVPSIDNFTVLQNEDWLATTPSLGQMNKLKFVGSAANQRVISYDEKSGRSKSMRLQDIRVSLREYSSDPKIIKLKNRKILFVFSHNHLNQPLAIGPQDIVNQWIAEQLNTTLPIHKIKVKFGNSGKQGFIGKTIYQGAYIKAKSLWGPYANASGLSGKSFRDIAEERILDSQNWYAIGSEYSKYQLYGTWGADLPEDWRSSTGRFYVVFAHKPGTNQKDPKKFVIVYPDEGRFRGPLAAELGLPIGDLGRAAVAVSQTLEDGRVVISYKLPSGKEEYVAYPSLPAEDFLTVISATYAITSQQAQEHIEKYPYRLDLRTRQVTKMMDQYLAQPNSRTKAHIAANIISLLPKLLEDLNKKPLKHTKLPTPAQMQNFLKQMIAFYIAAPLPDHYPQNKMGDLRNIAKVFTQILLKFGLKEEIIPFAKSLSPEIRNQKRSNVNQGADLAGHVVMPLVHKPLEQAHSRVSKDNPLRSLAHLFRQRDQRQIDQFLKLLELFDDVTEFEQWNKEIKEYFAKTTEIHSIASFLGHRLDGQRLTTRKLQKVFSLVYVKYQDKMQKKNISKDNPLLIPATFARKDAERIEEFNASINYLWKYVVYQNGEKFQNQIHKSNKKLQTIAQAAQRLGLRTSYQNISNKNRKSIGDVYAQALTLATKYLEIKKIPFVIPSSYQPHYRRFLENFHQGMRLHSQGRLADVDNLHNILSDAKKPLQSWRIRPVEKTFSKKEQQTYQTIYDSIVQKVRDKLIADINPVLIPAEFTHSGQAALLRLNTFLASTLKSIEQQDDPWEDWFKQVHDYHHFLAKIKPPAKTLGLNASEKQLNGYDGPLKSLLTRFLNQFRKKMISPDNPIPVPADFVPKDQERLEKLNRFLIEVAQNPQGPEAQWMAEITLYQDLLQQAQQAAARVKAPLPKQSINFQAVAPVLAHLKQQIKDPRVRKNMEFDVVVPLKIRRSRRQGFFYQMTRNIRRWWIHLKVPFFEFKESYAQHQNMNPRLNEILGEDFQGNPNYQANYFKNLVWEATHDLGVWFLEILTVLISYWRWRGRRNTILRKNQKTLPGKIKEHALLLKHWILRHLRNGEIEEEIKSLKLEITVKDVAENILQRIDTEDKNWHEGARQLLNKLSQENYNPTEKDQQDFKKLANHPELTPLNRARLHTLAILPFATPEMPTRNVWGGFAHPKTLWSNSDLELRNQMLNQINQLAEEFPDDGDIQEFSQEIWDIAREFLEVTEVTEQQVQQAVTRDMPSVEQIHLQITEALKISGGKKVIVPKSPYLTTSNDREFEKLRPYQRGDTQRDIDHNATARSTPDRNGERKQIVKEMRPRDEVQGAILVNLSALLEGKALTFEHFVQSVKAFSAKYLTGVQHRGPFRVIYFFPDGTFHAMESPLDPERKFTQMMKAIVHDLLSSQYPKLIKFYERQAQAMATSQAIKGVKFYQSKDNGISESEQYLNMAHLSFSWLLGARSEGIDEEKVKTIQLMQKKLRLGKGKQLFAVGFSADERKRLSSQKMQILHWEKQIATQDAALLAESQSPGGIDLRADQWDIEEQGDAAILTNRKNINLIGPEVGPMSLSPRRPVINGLEPVIIHIFTVQDVLLFLGG